MQKRTGNVDTFMVVGKVFEVSLLAFFVVTAFGIFDFVLPFFTETFTDNMAVIGLTVALLYLGSMFAEVPVGLMVDKYGRKSVLLVAIFELAIMGSVYYFTRSLTQLMLMEFVFGVLSVAFWVPSAVLVRDYSPQKMMGKLEGFYLTLSQIGWVIGPLIGGVIGSYFGIRANFIMVTAFLVVSFVYGAIVLEKKHFHGGKILKKVVNFVVFKEYRRVHPFSMTLFFLCFCLNMWIGVQWVFIQLACDRMFHLPEQMIGAMFAALMLIEVLLYFPAGYFMDKIGVKYIITCGFALLTVSAVLAYLSTNPFKFFFFLMLCAGATGWIAPGVESMLTKIIGSKNVGEMTGVFDTSKDLGLVMGPLVGGIIAQICMNAKVPFILVGIMALIGFGFSFHFWTRPKGAKPVDVVVTPPKKK